MKGLRRPRAQIERLLPVVEPKNGLSLGIVPSELMRPREAWLDAAAYDQAAKKLAGLFVKNFKQYEAGTTPEVRAASPAL